MASAQFTVNGSAAIPAVAVAASSLVTLALVSTDGVGGVEWSVIGNHSDSAVNPTLTPAGSPPGATATFTMPAGAGQGYLIRCTVNGGKDENGPNASLVYEAIVGVVNGSGVIPFVHLETTQRHPTHGYTMLMNAVLTGAALPLSGTADQIIKWNGSTWVAGALNLAAAAAITGLLPLANLTTGAAGTVLIGGATPSYSATPTVTSLAATSYLALGADPADAGAIRLSHAMGIYGESNTPGADRAVLTWGVTANDTVTLGDAAAATEIVGLSVGINTAAGTMLEAVEVAAGRRVVSLALGADLSTTEMPGNTGDRVIYVANCATAPTTGDPASGLILYGTSGALGLHAAGIKFHERVTAAGITHSARTTDDAASDFTVTVQAPWASATLTKRDARSFVVALSAPAGASTTEGALKITRSGSFQAQIAPYPGSPTTYTGIWLIPGVAPSATNYAVLESSDNLLLNAPNAGGAVYLRAAHSNNLLVASAAELNPYAPVISWPSTVTVPTIKQATHATTPQTMTFQAMNVTTGVGSNLVLTSGTGSTSDGSVQLQVGTESLVEACEVAAGRRVVALCRAAALTTTQMPANSGDGVVYIANAATAPTGTPVSGGILYSSGGDLYWMNTAGVSSKLN